MKEAMKDSPEAEVKENQNSSSDSSAKSTKSTKSATKPPMTGTTQNDTATIRTEEIQSTGEAIFRAVSGTSAAPAAAKGNQPTVYLTGMKLYLVLLGVGLVVFLMMLDQTIVVTAIPRITAEFKSTSDIGWYGSAYMLTIAAFQPLMGKLYQYYNSKWTFLIGLAIFEFGSLICALANSSSMLIIGRAISGAGGSGLVIGFLAILSVTAAVDKRPYYMGIVMGFSSLGLVLGPVLGGIFTEHATWRWCFWLNLPFGGVTMLILALINIPNAAEVSEKEATWKEQLNRLDLPGFALFGPAIIMLLLPLEWGGHKYDWKSPTIIGMFCGAVVMSAIFLFWEKFRGMDAMIPLPVLKQKVVIFAATTMTLSQGSLLVITFYLPIWFQVVKQASPTMGGVYYLPSVGSQVVGSFIAGALTTRFGFYTPWAVLGCALTSIASGLLSTMSPGSGTAPWVIFQLISGFSRGLTMQQPLTAIQAAVPKKEFPVASAFLMFAQILGGSIFISLAQTIFSNQLRPALALFAPEVDAARVIEVGTTAFRTVVAEESWPGVIQAYNKAITATFYLGAGAAAAAFCASFGMGWGNLIKIRQAEIAAQTAAAPSEEKV
ncbi:hypothetical protein HYFRA_00005947 [Hymenoscyphus fraxineus]|uniref:Major facilitator superfamily (MFS) profile domain-containing protein n=1 Tax=Hymenoscyphus fraxineus TaxID=746836 RepID=A0A9N9KVM9_9HELO|nr:hypothetical protein HYFRA_00005947 [Hymenoscyphus fraxineus]